MKLEIARQIAERVRSEMVPYCERVEIAGSIRRRKPEVRDIEIVAIPKPYDVGLFASGVALVVDRWTIVRGQLPCRYTQRILPEGIALDLFFATPENWGLIYAIRTGSADYSRYVLARGWVLNGYKGVDGMLTRDGVSVSVREEGELFRLAGVPWIEPEARNLYNIKKEKRHYYNTNMRLEERSAAE
jgi:DNA polymerase/3'-5' exonuclease PolX